MSDEVQQRAVPTSVLGTAATGRRDRTADAAHVTLSSLSLCFSSTYI